MVNEDRIVKCSLCEFYGKLRLILKYNARFQKNKRCVPCLLLLYAYVGVCECESPGRLCVSPLVLFVRRITLCGRRAFLPRRHSWPVLETTLCSHTYLCALFVRSSSTVWLRLLKWAGFVWMRQLVSDFHKAASVVQGRIKPVEGRVSDYHEQIKK